MSCETESCYQHMDTPIAQDCFVQTGSGLVVYGAHHRLVEREKYQVLLCTSKLVLLLRHDLYYPF